LKNYNFPSISNIGKVLYNDLYYATLQLQPKVAQIRVLVCITTYQPDIISNPNPNPTINSAQ